MNNYCEHTEVWSDESVLLDDNNTTNPTGCKRCRSNTNDNSNSLVQIDYLNGSFNSNMYAENERIHYEDQLDTPDDSPLLSPSPILTTDSSLHCHNVCQTKEDKSSVIKLACAALLCFLFMIAEIVGGYLAGSLAIMTDAAHLFADLISFIISIISIRLSSKSATDTMTFGYARAEVLGALFSIFAIWMLSIVFLTLAIERLWSGNYEIEANTMITVACLGLFINILMGAILHGICLSTHNQNNISHNHNNNYTNINVRAAIAHVIGDLLQSIGVLIAAIIIKIYPNLKHADPICTILFTIIAVIVTRKVAKDSIRILMETSPRDTKDVLKIFRSIPGVMHVHNLHVWTISPGRDSVTAHLAVDNNCDRDTILHRALLISKEKLNVQNCTIQIETYQESIINECDECKFLYN